MKDIISKIIDKISIAKILIAAGIAVTATTIALAIKALKKRLAAKKVKPVAPAQVIKLSELEEDKTFEDTEDELVEEEPETDIIDSEEFEDELEESDIRQEDIELSSVMVEESDPIEMGFGAMPFTNDTSKIDLASQSNEQEFDDEWYKKTLADLLNDESFLEPDEEYINPFAPKLSPEERKKVEFAIEQCEKMSDKIGEKIQKLGSDCPSEYYQLDRQVVLAKMRILRYYYGFD